MTVKPSELLRSLRESTEQADDVLPSLPAAIVDAGRAQRIAKRLPEWVWRRLADDRQQVPDTPTRRARWLATRPDLLRSMVASLRDDETAAVCEAHGLPTSFSPVFQRKMLVLAASRLAGPGQSWRAIHRDRKTQFLAGLDDADVLLAADCLGLERSNPKKARGALNSARFPILAVAGAIRATALGRVASMASIPPRDSTSYWEVLGAVLTWFTDAGTNPPPTCLVSPAWWREAIAVDSVREELASFLHTPRFRKDAIVAVSQKLQAGGAVTDAIGWSTALNDTKWQWSLHLVAGYRGDAYRLLSLLSQAAGLSRESLLNDFAAEFSADFPDDGQQEAPLKALRAQVAATLPIDLRGTIAVRELSVGALIAMLDDDNLRDVVGPTASLPFELELAERSALLHAVHRWALGRQVAPIRLVWPP